MARRKTKLRKYEVEVTRTSIGSRLMHVWAPTAREAKARALAGAGDLVFTDDDADYAVTGCERIEREKPCPENESNNHSP